MSETKYAPVNIEIDIPGLGTFTDGNQVWKVTSLIYHVEQQKLDVFDLPLCGINIANRAWESDGLTIKEFAKHWKRANEADLNYPVILDDDGFIMDGWHRVAKALFLGMSTIKAVRFDETPVCDYVKSD